MNFREKMILFVASGGFIGYIPVAPGTFGSLLGLPFCFFLSLISPALAMIFILIFMYFAILVAAAAEQILGQKDPGRIVIDEITGVMVIMFGLPFNSISVPAGFFLFRALDILKPFPIRLLERRLPGGFGVVLDDVLAGIFGNILLRLVFFGIEVFKIGSIT
jgi:phosphatidylglycerophosphatase A